MASKPGTASNSRLVDPLFDQIADYVLNYRVESKEALDTAGLCLMDSVGCALLALNYPACTKLLGPIVPGAELNIGARIPGLRYQLEPVQAAFNIGAMIRWLDFNDTWLAAEWGHPSDNLGGILAISDFISGQNIESGKPPPMVKDILTAMVKTYEIQGIIALNNSFNSVGLDHVLLVRIATAAVVTGLLGGNHQQIINAVSNAWIDGGALRCYRHAPNTGSRKSWAAGDATSRGVRLALLAMQDEMGYPSALSAKQWGFCDVLYQGNALELSQDFGTYVIENILFKISFPAEFHAQTAVEAAIVLHDEVKDRLDHIERVVLQTQQAAIRIIDKTGQLNNPADRDHCLQYMVAIGLIFGNLTAEHYEDGTASDPRIDSLRAKMEVVENKSFSVDYLDPDKRSIGNTVCVVFKDGSQTRKVEIQYPLGHRRRRNEGIPLLKEKFESNLTSCFSEGKCQEIMRLFEDRASLEASSVDQFMELFSIDHAS